MAEESTQTADELLAAWRQLCETAAKAGEQILRPEVPTDDLTVAEGFRYLARLVGQSFDMFIEDGDTERPVVAWSSTRKRKPMFLNPDQTYHSISVNGQHTYRLTGTLPRPGGKLPLLEVQTWTGTMFVTEDTSDEGTRDNAIVDFLFEDDIDFDDDGNFEITISADRHEGNWLGLAPNAFMVLIRQYVTDWEASPPWDLDVECLNGPDEPFRLDPERVKRAFEKGGLYALGVTSRWLEWVDEFEQEGKVNNFPRWIDTEDVFAPRGIRYRTARYEIQPDEALIIEFEEPQCPYWGITPCNFWMEVSDWQYGETASLNNETATVDEDGWVRVVLSHSDPGVQNWLPTQGHTTGLFTLRWAREYEWEPESRARLVKLDAVGAELQ